MRFRHFPNISKFPKIVYTMFISKNRASFHLWWNFFFLKHQKVSKYYEIGCRYETPVRERAFFATYSTNLYYCYKRLGILSFQLVLVESETAHIWKKLDYSTFKVFFLFADDDVKMNDLELHFYKVFRYKCFCKKTILGTYLSERIKSLVRHLHFMAGQKHSLVRYLILPQTFPVGRNVRCVFCLIGHFLILVGCCPMSDRYFKAWNI